jgi:hypothetical protein
MKPNESAKEHPCVVRRKSNQRKHLDGRGITGGRSGYAALLAHAGGALYGTELGSVTLKRIGFVLLFSN